MRAKLLDVVLEVLPDSGKGDSGGGRNIVLALLAVDQNIGESTKFGAILTGHGKTFR